jgi:phosphate transport system permease protein
MSIVSFPGGMPKSDAEVSLPQLERSLRSPRTLFSYMMSLFTGLISLVAMIPLASVLIFLFMKGQERLGISLFTQLPPAAGMVGGGIGNALVGTLVIVALAAAISVPIGILAAVYLAEIGPETRTATAVRFCTKVLTGLPSILAGVFAFTLVVMAMGKFSALAGGVALAVLMVPTITLTAEEAIRMVPARMKDAAIGMGATRTQVILQVVLPTARPGLLTGVMLAIARAAGETAPLLFTALFSDYWLRHLTEPTPSLAVLIYDFSGSPYPNQIEIAWAASLVLVVMVLILNVGSQLLLRRYYK